jgi:hypothetical protein
MCVCARVCVCVCKYTSDSFACRPAAGIVAISEWGGNTAEIVEMGDNSAEPGRKQRWTCYEIRGQRRVFRGALSVVCVWCKYGVSMV